MPRRDVVIRVNATINKEVSSEISIAPDVILEQDIFKIKLLLSMLGRDLEEKIYGRKNLPDVIKIGDKIYEKRDDENEIK